MKDRMRAAASENHQTIPYSPRRVVLITLLSWLCMLGFDFFLHAGLLARLYLQPDPFLLPPAEAFRRIPLGYLSFLLTAAVLVRLMVRLGITGWRAGLVCGLKLGAVLWGIQVLGLLSISTARPILLAGWFVGQTLELALGGAVAGSGLAGMRLRHLLVWVVAAIVLLSVITVALQTLGLAPSVRM